VEAASEACAARELAHIDGSPGISLRAGTEAEGWAEVHDSPREE
jgi:hypothetical protein